MVIREIAEPELDVLLDLYRDLHTADHPRPAREVVEGLWRRIRESPDLKYFGVFEDGTLVSSCTLAIIPNLTRGGRPYGLIENVVTRAARRRQGFGRAVLRHALDHAWARGCYKVMLLTGRLDEGTFHFYESAGFDRRAKQAFLARPPQAEGKE